ncbi:hypothetical protein Y032_0015g2853 [Ancylostoma ceylanicum]|nr:hypothetical protein Y032_0015g2853 [Ancylostoma ceylanicum]
MHYALFFVVLCAGYCNASQKCTWASESIWDGFVAKAPKDLVKLVEDQLKTKLDPQDILLKFEYTYTDGNKYLLVYIGQLKEDIATVLKYNVTKNGPVRPRDVSFSELTARLRKCAMTGPPPTFHEGAVLMARHQKKLLFQ